KNFDPAAKVGGRLSKLCEQHGMIGRAMINDAMGFSPPLIITESEVDTMLDRFGQALDALTVELRREKMAVVG
ncbi:MAG: aspartate aminotransferase family protein, partial [Xanthobacteraceae bacterium]